MEKNNELAKLRKDIETYKAAGEELGAEIIKLKKQNAALRGYNGTLKKENAALRYEREELESKVMESKEEIDGIRDKLIKTSMRVEILEKQIKEKESEIYGLNTAIEWEKRPWWKKIF